MKYFRAFLLAALSCFSLWACSLLGPSQQDVRSAFQGASSGVNQANSASASMTQYGPPTWILTYYLTQSGGGSITLHFAMNVDPNSAPYAGEVVSINGSSLTLSNFRGNGYTYNGTITLGGSMTVTTDYATGHLVLNMNYSYLGSVNVSGSSSFVMVYNYVMYLSEDSYTGAVTSGPTFSGTITVNGKSYDVNTLISTSSAEVWGRGVPFRY